MTKKRKKKIKERDARQTGLCHCQRVAEDCREVSANKLRLVHLSAELFIALL